MTDDTINRINRRRAAIDKQMAELRDEDAELETALRVISRLAHAIEQSSPPEPRVRVRHRPIRSDNAPPVIVPPTMRANESIENLIQVFLMENTSAWATSQDIKVWLDERLSRDVPMSTVSPTLSNLKNKGLIVRDGLKVAASSRVANSLGLIKHEGGPMPAEDSASNDDLATEPLLDPNVESEDEAELIKEMMGES